MTPESDETEGGRSLAVLPPPALREAPRAAPTAERSLVIVANRLPTQRVGRGAEARWELSPGGLVSALEPALSRRGGVWIGWSGASGEAPGPFRAGRIENIPVPVSRREVAEFYEGFANRTLWPLLHDAIRQPVFERRWWETYRRVNRRFAEAAARSAARGADVWIHDYQLLLAPAMLRALRPDVRIGFFLHIPFPPVELFSRLPWAEQVVEGVLGADVAGFQTAGDAANFRRMARDVGAGTTTGEVVRAEGREVVAREFPISIDVSRQAALASAPAARMGAERLRESLGRERQILLGVDRLDYTKGIEQRLCAYRSLLRSGRARIDRHVLVQIAVPSRENVREYREARRRIEGLVGEINGQHGEVGRVAVHYLRRSLKPDRLAAFYRAADVMLVTPLRDGMNLIAKEYVASREHEDGALALSRFAGAARELSGAVMCNPHDVEGLAESIGQALEMSADEAAARMRRMRAAVAEHDVHRWAGGFLKELGRDRRRSSEA